jgi:phosphate transport system substrate-binding protein
MLANAMKVAGAIAATTGLAVVNTAQAQLSGLINIDGSSTVFPVTEAMAEEFISGNSGVRITVGVSGTGGGFRKFCAGETEISNASRPIKDEEKAACAAAGVDYVELLIGLDAITVVVAENNDWLTNITTEELNTLWAPEAENSVNRWNQVNSSWPNEPVRLFGPGTDSGTFDFFTEEINGEGGASRADYTASEDDNVLVLGVSRDRNAMGYFGLAYYLESQDKLNAVSVNGVAPNADTAKSGEYPLARSLFIYVNKEAMSRPEIRAFVEYYITTARDTDIITEVGYVPLERSAYDADLSRL